MGIRMHLCVGYGLKLSENRALDPNKLQYSNLEDPERFERFRNAVFDFAAEHKETIEKVAFHESMQPPKSLEDMVMYESEFGDPDRVVMIPAGQHKHWVRYGNHLDAFLYEAQLGNAQFDMETEWIPHPGTLYPYIGLMKPNLATPLGVEKYWVSCYRDQEEHKDAIAWAPWHLWLLIKHLFDLDDVATASAFLSLRPGIYRYWC